MTSRERVLTALNQGASRGVPDKVPLMDLSIDYKVATSILGTHSYTPWELADRLGLDAVGYPLYPDIFVVNKTGIDGRSYIVDGRIKSHKDMDMVRLANPHSSGIVDRAKKFVDSNPGEKAVWAATNLGMDPVLLGMGLPAFSYALVDDPNLIRDLFSVYAEWEECLVSEFAAIGFDFVWFTDDIAYKDGPMFSPNVFTEFFEDGIKQVSGATDLPWVYHSDGDMSSLISRFIEIGMSGLHPIEPGPMDIARVKEDFGRNICLVGNVPVDMLTTGTPDQVREEVRRLIEIAAPGGGYIVSSSNSIASYCNPANILALAQAVDEYGWYVK